MTTPGDFSSVRDEMKRMAYEDMYSAITKADGWADVAAEPSGAGFMYSSNPNMDQIHAALNNRMAHHRVRNIEVVSNPYIGRIHAALNDRVGHSGASMRSTMRAMQYLARTS
jgi:tetrahydromethanopterin S-methyltransferase subunit F